MKVQISKKYSIETQHPASHYGAGVLVDEESGKIYGPADTFPTSLKRFFGSDAQVCAGDVVVSTIRNPSPSSFRSRYSEEEINQVRAYLSQDPQGRFSLPSYAKLLREWAKAEKDNDSENI